MTDAATTDRQDLTVEYVAGGVGLWSRQQVKTLPPAIDDITADFGDDLYDRMDLDPQVRANKNILKAAIIEDGCRLSSPIEDEAADGYALAQEIAAFCDSVLCELTQPLDDTLWDLLDAILLGSRVAEKVWTLQPATSYALPGTSPIARTPDLLVLSNIKPKPRNATAFVVDNYMNVVGLATQQTGQLFTVNQTMASEPAQIPNLIERDRFAVVTFRPKNADPRGTSAFRAAYTPWFAKQQIWPEFLKYLAQFASPSIYAIASETASRQGVKVQNADGSYSTKSAVEVLLDTLLAFRNGTAAAFDYGTVLNALAVSGEGEAFHAAFTRCDQQITIAVLHQTLATMEAQYQARASSEVHQDTLDTIERQAKRSVCLMMRRDILRPLVEYNYGPDAARHLTPVCSLGEVEQQDRAAMINAIANLARADYIDPSQYPGIDRELGLPPREAMDEPMPEPPGDTDMGEDGGEDMAGDGMEGMDE